MRLSNLLLMTFVSILMSCSPQVGAPCLTDSECGAANRCLDGICEETGAAGDAGQVILPRSCAQDAECRASELCVEGACVEGDCRTDAECDEDWLTCAENRCRAECSRDADCDEFGTEGAMICESGGCRPGCRVDTECEVPYICDQERLVCDMECNSAADCPGGALCTNGRCRGCQSDLDCAENQFCLDGVGCVACLEDRHCGSGEVCDGIRRTCVPSDGVGVCQPDASEEARCDFEGGCQPGLECTEVDDGWATFAYCMKPCEVTSDCPNAFACFRNYCRPFSSQQELTCEAYSELGNPCRSSEECGANALPDDSICSGFGRYSDPPRCTWFCSSDRDCPADHFCEDPPPQEVRQGRRRFEVDPQPRCAPR
ncbi:MAG: hypothetical protein CMH58_07535 [Myxococcales bacterium]|nr:hypothetical protein [Myxococcales bacterium]